MKIRIRFFTKRNSGKTEISPKSRSKPKFYLNFGKNPNFSEISENIAEILAKIILFTFSMQPNIVAHAS